MRIADKTKEQLIEELEALRLRTAELERTEAMHKRREEAIRRLEEEKLSILSSMSEHVVYQNSQHRILWANKAAAEAAGLPREQLVGCYCYEVWPKRSEPCVDCPVAKARETGKPQASEMTTPDGKVWFVQGYPIRDTEDQIVGLVEMALEVTERKQVEEALRTGERKYELLFESTLDGMFVLDAETLRVVLANQAAVDIYGLGSVEEAIGLNLLDCVPPEERERVLRIVVKDMFENDLRQVNEFRGITKDGREIWVSAVGTRTEYRGKVAGLISFSDITERKQAEEALQTEKNKLLSVVDAIEYGLSIQDRDYNILYQSQPMVKTSGYHLGEKCYRAYSARDKVCDDCPVGKAFKDGKSHTLERKVVTPQGKVIFLEHTASPVRDAEGEIVSCLEVTRNITERKKAEEALREGEEKYRTIFENVSDVVVRLDKRGKVIDANKRVEDYFGYKPNEIIGRNFVKLGVLSPKDLPKIVKLFSAGVKGKFPSLIELEVKRKDGSTAYLEANTTLVKKNGKTEGAVTIIRDITERKRAEEALADEATRRRILIDQSRDGIVVLDENGKVYEANQRFAEMLGYTPEEVTQLYVWDWEYLFPREQVQEMIRTVDEAGDHFETQHRRKDGTTYDVEISTNGAVFAGQKLVFCVCRDITERKQAEEAVRESEETLRKMFESVTDGISVVSLDGIIIDVNQRTVEMHGFSSKDEILGKSALELVAPADHKRVAINMRKALTQGVIQGVEYTLLKADGSEFPGELSTNVLKDAAGKAVGHITISRDITGRKRAEEELKLRAQILDSATDSIFVHDADDNFIYVNEAACQTHGYSREEFMKMKLPQLVDPERGRSLDSDRQEILDKGYIVTESAHLRKDGSLMPVEVHARTIESGGRKLFLTVAHDITERKRMEEEREEMEEKAHLASRLASVGEMASGIAHEINNPLTSVIGFSQLLMEGDIPADVKEDVGIIYKEAQRAAGVAKNLLTFARKQAPAKQPTNINSIIDGVLKLRAYEQRVNNIKVDSQLAPDLPEVMADYSQLQQVFINLIINAESAMIGANKGGTLTITTQKVNKTVKASFSDDGPGITKENLDRIFDPFFTTKEVGKGTGLGLSVCHGIVAEHNGRIYARSRPGRGATFVVELPVNNS